MSWHKFMASQIVQAQSRTKVHLWHHHPLSLCLGDAYLQNFKEGQFVCFPTTTTEKQSILQEELVCGFCSWKARSVKIDIHLSANEWQLNLFSASSKKPQHLKPLYFLCIL